MMQKDSSSQEHEEVECKMLDYDHESIEIDRCDTNSLIDEINDSCRQSHREEVNDVDESIDNINIELLEPITTTAVQTSTSTMSPKVSREGLRKQKIHKSLTATMINRTIHRKKKTAEQLEYLNNLYKKLNGNWDGKVKREAMRKTGLSRM